MTIDELYDMLGKERDLNFEMSRKVKGADKKILFRAVNGLRHRPRLGLPNYRRGRYRGA